MSKLNYDLMKMAEEEFCPKKEKSATGIFWVLILLFSIGCLFFGLAKINKDNLKQEYEFETYYDEESGITMRIFKDGLGDVLWCEPIEAEMEANE